MKRIIIETSLVGNIPIMTLIQQASERRPVIFFVHGFTGDKRDGLPLGYRLAELGFYVISVDAHMHGDRFDKRLEIAWQPTADLIYPPGTGLDAFFLMHEIVVQTARDIDTVIAHLETDKRADTAHIGITGLSMGGFTTFYTAATNSRIQVAVPMIGIPAFTARWQDVILEASSYTQWRDAMDKVKKETEKRTTFMHEIDPFTKMAQFFPKPLLMLNGDKDTDSPKKYSVDLYRDLEPLYAVHPERLRLSIHDDAAHQVTPAMITEACDWFVTYLRTG